jgi:hypothetical protein
MENPTVKQVIEHLSKCNPDAIFCRMEVGDDKPIYSTVEIIRSVGVVGYIDDAGDDKIGEVVGVY